MATNTNPFYTYSATAGSSKTLQKPQDGGDNNQWGNYINTDLDEIVSAVNALSDKIADASENTLVDFTATGSAVNHVGITNAAAGNGPTISAAGSESDVDLNVTAKGTGDINLTPGTNGDVNIPSGKGVTFGDDGEKIEGDGTDLTIASSNDLNLTATTDINVPADVGLTFGNDGEKIEGDGTDLTIASSATLNVNTGSSSGNDLKVNTSQLVVEGDTGNVGIGKTPDTRLNVGGTAPQIRAYGDSNSGAFSSYGSFNGSDLFVGIENSSGGLSKGSGAYGRFIHSTGAYPLSIYTNGTERIQVKSGGDVEVKTGNLVIGTAGKGIDFSNQSAGSGMDLELLDHYEEGEYQVTSLSTSGGGTVPISSSYDMLSYVRIGSMVHVGGELIVSGTLSGTDGALLIPLPFAVKNKTDSAENFNGSLALFTVNIDSGTCGLTTRVVGGNTYADMLSTLDNNSYVSITGGNINSNSRLDFGIQYITSA